MFTSKIFVIPTILNRLYDSLFANLSETYPAHLLRKRWEVSAGTASVPSLVDGGSTASAHHHDHHDHAAAVSADGRTFLAFTGSASLHPKELTPTVRRDDNASVSGPPKLCHGCAAELSKNGHVKVGVH